jgi:hypothetical protein
MNSDHRRQRADKSFKQGTRARLARKAMTEYENQAHAFREKMARLKALRLAKKAQAQNEQPTVRPLKATPESVLRGLAED